MKKTEALVIVKGFGQVRESDVRRIALNEVRGWLDLIDAVVLAMDSKGITRRLAEYDKALEVAFA